MKEPIPILILGGSDRRPGPPPLGVPVDDVLSGHKGALMLPWSRSLAGELVERYRLSGRFADPILLGPDSIYDGLVDCEIVDVDGSLVVTLTRVLRLILERFAGGTPVAVSTCDILPTPDEIRALLETEYDPHAESCFWWQWTIAEPHELGASAWKPRYSILPDPDAQPQTFYPGHLVVFRPETLRLEMLNRLLVLAYRYRNKPLHERLFPMLLRGLATMLSQDVRNLAKFQLPILTCSIPWNILRMYLEHRRNRMMLSNVERHLARVLVHRRHRKATRPVAIALTRITSFAQDIDTKSEFEAAIARGPVQGETG